MDLNTVEHRTGDPEPVIWNEKRLRPGYFALLEMGNGRKNSVPPLLNGGGFVVFE